VRAQLLRDSTHCCAVAGGTNTQYKSKARALLFNLRDSNNPQLRGRVLAGDIQPDALVQMTSEELASKVR
jgi:transcription elongation factor S-II